MRILDLIARASPKALSVTEVQIWVCALDLIQDDLMDLSRILSPEEISRAERFKFPKDRKHFIQYRSILRLILSQYLEWPPEQIEFAYGPYGKPSLKSFMNPQNLVFNLAHSNEGVLYGFSSEGNIGVDIEYVVANDDIPSIISQFFNPLEIEEINKFPQTEMVNLFFQYWTLKESYMKAIGKGLSVTLSDIAVILHKGDPIVSRMVNFPEDKKEWTIYSFKPMKDYMGAITVDMKKSINIVLNTSLASG